MTITYTMFNGELGEILVANKELRLDFSRQGFAHTSRISLLRQIFLDDEFRIWIEGCKPESFLVSVTAMMAIHQLVRGVEQSNPPMAERDKAGTPHIAHDLVIDIQKGCR